MTVCRLQTAQTDDRTFVPNFVFTFQFFNLPRDYMYRGLKNHNNHNEKFKVYNAKHCFGLSSVLCPRQHNIGYMGDGRSIAATVQRQLSVRKTKRKQLGF